jgi:hypothetical protein
MKQRGRVRGTVNLKSYGSRTFSSRPDKREHLENLRVNGNVILK